MITEETTEDGINLALNLRIGRLFASVASAFAPGSDFPAYGEFDTSGIDWQDGLRPCMVAWTEGRAQAGLPHIVCLRQEHPIYDAETGSTLERMSKKVSNLSGSGHVLVLKHVKRQIAEQLRKCGVRESWEIAVGAEGFVKTESIVKMIFKPTGLLLGKAA
jgi:hypothetical protein